MKAVVRQSRFVCVVLAITLSAGRHARPRVTRLLKVPMLRVPSVLGGKQPRSPATHGRSIWSRRGAATYLRQPSSRENP
jgi:hypothetical protein